MDPTTSFAVALSVYVLLLLGVGLLATRRASSSSEEYFLAGRGLGTLVLFMALFGTNCTAFVLVGIPGQAYHDGIGVFERDPVRNGAKFPLCRFLRPRGVGNDQGQAVVFGHAFR